MEWLLQFTVDVAIAVFVVLLWRNHKALRQTRHLEQRSLACYNLLEEKTLQLDKAIKMKMESLDEELSTLNQICAQAKSILEKGQARLTSYTPSLEELELRSLVEATGGAFLPVAGSQNRYRSRQKTNAIVANNSAASSDDKPYDNLSKASIKTPETSQHTEPTIDTLDTLPLNDVPTLVELEQAKTQFQKQMTMDLKTILTAQLL